MQLSSGPYKDHVSCGLSHIPFTHANHTHAQPHTQTFLTNPLYIMGSIVSAIGRGINAIISAIANVIMTIISVIVTIIVTIFDVIFDIICCRCFGGRKRRTGTHSFGRKRGGMSSSRTY